MKKTLLWFASLLFFASLAVPNTVWADDPPNCGPIDCPKPIMALAAGLRA